ncbi:TPA: amidohydrolase family protein [Pseudomonas aeruginosa]|nr:amidohydrolase family protein [Pseudomonas aeruginosa]HEP9173706.1 amidohydrolase family protein [Pseudomonas aeruginosa]
MEINLTRRQTLILALMYSATLSGCCHVRSKIRPYCPTSPAISYLDGPLTIDTHCHVFNGSDLHISPFLSRVLIHDGDGAVARAFEALTDFIQNISWALAPRGERELMELALLTSCEDEFATNQSSDAKARVYEYGGAGALRQRAHSAGREELQAAAKRTPQLQTLLRLYGASQLTALDEATQTKLAAALMIEKIPEKVEDYIDTRSDKAFSVMSLSEKSASGIINFLLQNFQYRYVSVHDYLRTYNVPGKRVVDLMLPSMVDYDWWLAEGRSTQTTLSVQIQVAEQISILTGGRVHAFVPFDPLKQVAFELYGTGEDSLGVAKRAILSHGCVGIKLYPPMGFAALGNTDLRMPSGNNFWARDWLPDLTDRPDIGQRLDNAMRELFAWCVDAQVPIMAHTNISNGVTSEFEELAGAKYWAKALHDYPNLRISFGHFGGLGSEKGLNHSKEFAKLMSAAPGAPGQFAYADAAYISEVLNGDPKILEALEDIYDRTAMKRSAALANRFMYGTDWEMTLAHGNVGGYLSDWANLLQAMEARPAIKQAGLVGLSDKFFGLNAAEWIGLRQGEESRRRLNAFYAANGVSPPDWAMKIDA